MLETRIMRITKSSGNTILRIPKCVCDALDVSGGDYARVSLREDGVIEVVFEKDKLLEFQKNFKKIK